MNQWLLILLSVALLACHTEPSPTNNNKSTIVKDSNLIKKEALNPYVPIDVSPMDISYFPGDYPLQKMDGETKTLPLARIVYSRPHRQGRKIFGDLLKWDQPWRLGANEASEIQFYQPVTIMGKPVAKGSYVIYAVPHKSSWTIILNSNLYTWGLRFDTSADVYRFTIPSVEKNQLVEYFTMLFQKSATGADLVMAWENIEARLPIQF